MNKFLFLVVLSVSALFATNADAFKVSVCPSITFRSSNQTCYPCARQVVTAPPVMQVRRYVDPYTGCSYYYEAPVYPAPRVVNSYYYPQYYQSQGTDFQLQFRIR